MSNTAISQALVEIEKNLEKLSTARKQVVDVTQSGEELTGLITELTGKVDELLQSILKESDSYNNAFIQSHESFEQKLNTLLEKSDNSISKFQESIQNIEPEISQKINEIAASTLEKSKTLNTQHEIYFDKITKNINEYKNALEEFSKSVTNKSLDLKFDVLEKKLKWSENNVISGIEEFKSENKNLHGVNKHKVEENNNKILELLKNQQVILDQLVVQDKILTEQFELQRTNSDYLNDNIKKLRSKQDNMNYVTWTLIILTALGIIFLK
jgi:hypothetical protein